MLQSLGVHRVTDVSERNKRRTQRLAAKIFERGEWDGISWWSYYHPSITLVATWLQDGIACTRTEPLSIESAPVEEAARRIVRTVR